MQQEFETPGDALAHVGVKGMRWGHRKAQDTGGGGGGGPHAPKNLPSLKRKAGGSPAPGVKGAKPKAPPAAKATAPKPEKKAKAKKPEDPNSVGNQLKREGKGAAWGTRQAYIEKTLDDAERLRKISKGEAGIDQKAFATKDLVFTKGQAKRVAPILERHVERMRKGEMKTGDILLASARVRRRDLTIGMDLANKKKKAAAKRGREVNFDIPVKKTTRKPSAKVPVTA